MTLESGMGIGPNGSVESSDGRYKLIYQTDGNLVLYGGNQALWASDTAGHPGGKCVMQSDGNLVIYGPSNEVVWASGTQGNPGSRLVVRNDGNVLIYRNGITPIWSTGTSKIPWKAESWMGDIFSDVNYVQGPNGNPVEASSVALGKIAIPGSHDSGAYFTRGLVEEVDPVFGLRLDELDPTAALGRFPNTTARWARTQRYDLYTQASLGARCFDIRPYWKEDTKELRTYHTLDCASFDDVFTSVKTGHTGLNKFINENKDEILIIQLSQFKTGGENDSPRYRRAMIAMADYLKQHVIPHAVPAAEFGNNPGNVTLKRARELRKNYVVTVDNDYAFYKEMQKVEGVADHIFSYEDHVSGGYAGMLKSVEYEPGRHSSTNLWNGLVDEDLCKNKSLLGLRKMFKTCNPGRGSEDGPTVRRAIETELINKIQQHGPKKGSLQKGLHETSYIWVYGIFGGVNKLDVALYIRWMDRASLISATEDALMDARGIEVSPLLPGVNVGTIKLQAGLLPYGKDFIQRLDAAAKSAHRGVNIVNMDAIGKTHKTSDGFIRPLMNINLSLLRDPTVTVAPSAGS